MSWNPRLSLSFVSLSVCTYRGSITPAVSGSAFGVHDQLRLRASVYGILSRSKEVVRTRCRKARRAWVECAIIRVPDCRDTAKDVPLRKKKVFDATLLYLGHYNTAVVSGTLHCCSIWDTALL